MQSTRSVLLTMFLNAVVQSRNGISCHLITSAKRPNLSTVFCVSINEKNRTRIRGDPRNKHDQPQRTKKQTNEVILTGGSRSCFPNIAFSTDTRRNVSQIKAEGKGSEKNGCESRRWRAKETKLKIDSLSKECWHFKDTSTNDKQTNSQRGKTYEEYLLP